MSGKLYSFLIHWTKISHFLQSYNCPYKCNITATQLFHRKANGSQHEGMMMCVHAGVRGGVWEGVHFRITEKYYFLDIVVYFFALFVFIIWQVKLYAMKCLSSVWNIKFGNIHCMANLVAGLVSYYDNVGIYVVDGVLEDIRAGMEVCGTPVTSYY